MFYFLSKTFHVSGKKKKNGIMEQLVSFAGTVREQNYIIAVFLERLESGIKPVT